MQYSTALLASALAAIASAQTSLPPITAGTTVISGAQETHLVNDLESYLNNVKTQPAFSSVQSVLSTAIPDQANFVDSLTAPADANFAFVSALPSDAQSYLSSVGAAVESIATKDLQGPAPTNKPFAIAAGVAAAGAGVAAMIL